MDGWSGFVPSPGVAVKWPIEWRRLFPRAEWGRKPLAHDSTAQEDGGLTSRTEADHHVHSPQHPLQVFQAVLLQPFHRLIILDGVARRAIENEGHEVRGLVLEQRQCRRPTLADLFIQIGEPIFEPSFLLKAWIGSPSGFPISRATNRRVPRNKEHDPSPDVLPSDQPFQIFIPDQINHAVHLS